MFFVHWSQSETNLVWRSDPIEIGDCQFCKEPNCTAIYKVYNTKTKHYSAFSLGKGDFKQLGRVGTVLQRESLQRNMKNN